MNATRTFLVLLALLALPAWLAAEKREARRLDVTKSARIELPTTELIAGASGAAQPALPPEVARTALERHLRDRGKADIELPVKAVIAPSPALAATNYAPAEAFTNPKVEPGKVRWHKDFSAACEAAKKSGKPVLLFQMMGKLDDRFC